MANATVWVYVRSEPGLWTVGFYTPAGKWEAESDHDSPAKAAARVHYLNGGNEEKKEVPNMATKIVAAVCEKQLFAAAPDLLTALQGMLREFGNQRFKVRKDYSKMICVEAARKAIAKAEGAQ